MAVYKITGEIIFDEKTNPYYDIEDILCFMSDMTCDEYREAYVNLEVVKDNN